VKKLILLTLSSLFIITQYIWGQATTPTNTFGFATDYLGWDATVGSPPLLIKTTNPDPINFATSGTARMQIRSNGNVGIGNYGAFTAAERLHLRESTGNRTVFLMTGNNTGDNVTDGFHISVNNNATATLQSVDLNQQENASLNFLTNALPRMQIISNGNVGIGNYTAFTPQNLLHQLSGSNTTFHQFSTNNTTADVNRGATIGIDWTANPYSVGNNYSPAELTQFEFAPILFRSVNSTVSGNPISERIRIVERPGFFWGTITGNITKVTINRGTFFNTTTSTMVNTTFNNPVAMLNIGTELPGIVTATSWAGNRLWMDVGIYNNYQTDNMYIGLKQEAAFDNLDAVINWGDNLPGSSNNDGIQNLRFIFTALGSTTSTYGSAPASTQNGLEVARMTSNGNVGIGDFYNNGTTVWAPAARLEILDAKDLSNNYPNTSRNEPQLKLTYKHETVAMFSVATDFTTTSLGDLCINPYSGASSIKIDRYVGINTTTPQNTLDINANGNYVATAPNSGLRLRDMRSGSSAGPSNGKVLSVDVDGNVILVDDQGAGSLSICGGSFGTSAINYINKISAVNTICPSGIFEDAANNVGIGIATSVAAKLHVKDFVTTNPTFHDGIYSEVNGGTTCRSYSSFVDNSSTLNSTNIGYHTFVNCRSAATGFSTNTGFNAYLQVLGGASVNTGFNCGVGSSNSPNAVVNYGGYFSVLNAITNVGLYAEALPTNGLGTATTCYGIRTLAGAYNANIPQNTYAGYFVANGASTINYGVYASGSGGSCTTSSCNFAAGYFSGDVYATASYVTSDLFLKNNIQPLTNSTALLQQLNPVSYTFNTQQYPSMHLNTINNFGAYS
jgi:hypothetical protein